MILFNGQTVLTALHESSQVDKPTLHTARNHFAGVQGESQIVLGTGGRDISIPVWLNDASFGSAAAVDAYRQFLDLGVGNVGPLSITDKSGNLLGYYNDTTFEGFEKSGPCLPAIGSGMAAGSYWQPGTLHFHQNSMP